MILYLVYDSKNQSCTAPAIATDFNEAEQALLSINPENIDDLHIHVLTQLHSFLDLFLLDVNVEKPLPNFILQKSTPAIEDNGVTQQPEGVSDSSL